MVYYISRYIFCQLRNQRIDVSSVHRYRNLSFSSSEHPPVVAAYSMRLATIFSMGISLVLIILRYLSIFVLKALQQNDFHTFPNIFYK